MHKDIYINDEQTQYILTDTGLLFNEKTGKVSQGSRKNGYLYYQLTHKNQIYNFAKHRLLAEYFIPNPENKPIVHHIDGNPLNNNLNNLQWVTQSENMQKIINLVEEKKNIILTEEELTNEHWVKYNDIYEVSDLGRLKNIKTNKITFGSINKNSGYIRWNLQGHEEQAHRLIYKLFHPEETIKFINHIDGNRNNNKLSNLENVSQRINCLKSIYGTGKGRSYPVGQFDDNWNLLKTYPSMAEAARRIGAANTSCIRNAWKKQNHAYGYYWKVLDKNEYDQALENPQIENILGIDVIDNA